MRHQCALLVALIVLVCAIAMNPRSAAAATEPDPAAKEANPERDRLIAQGDEKRKAGDLNASLDLYQEARRAGGDDPKLLLTIAVTAYNAQSFDAGREALAAYLKAVPEKANDTRIIELRAALEKGTPTTAPSSLTANQRLALSTVNRMVEDLLTAQTSRQEDEVNRLIEGIRPRLEDLRYSAACEDQSLWRTTGVFALAVKDADIAAWATEALMRLTGENWDKDVQLAELLPRLNRLADASLLKCIQEERAYLASIQAKEGQDVSPDSIAKMMVDRGNTYQEKDPRRSLLDYALVVQMTNVTGEQRARALNNLGLHLTGSRRVDYCTLAIETDGLSNALLCKILFNRGVTYGDQGAVTRAIADYTQVIGVKDASAEQVARALYNRGIMYARQADATRAVADYTQVIEMNGASAEQVAQALFNRGVTYGKQKDTTRAVVDFTQVIEMKNAPAEQVAKALFNRGRIKEKVGDADRAIADYTRAIEMYGAPAELVAKSRVNRGNMYGKQGNASRAKVDYQMVIDMEDASLETKRLALSNLDNIR